jgi:hypothetical protein
MIIVCPPIPFLSVINGPGPDSGIVNFYQMKDTLMAHADRAEYVNLLPYPTCLRIEEGLIYRLDPNRPLISIS